MSGYRLVFGYSSSPSYPEAVRLASALPAYAEDGRGRAVRHSAPIMLELLATEERLLGLVRGWRSSCVTADDEVLDRAALWALWRVVSCYRAHETSRLEELHCLGAPGGVARTVPCRVISRSLPWTLGHEYRDPELLPRLLHAHARRTLVDACPAYDPPGVARAVRKELTQRGASPTTGLSEATAHDVSSRAAQRSRAWLERLLDDLEVNLEP